MATVSHLDAGDLVNLSNRLKFDDYQDWLAAWQYGCQPAKGQTGNLLWRYGKQVCSVGRDRDLRDCQVIAEAFLDQEIQRKVDLHLPGTAWPLLEGAVYCIQAACADKLQAPRGAYLQRAVEAFQQIPFGSGTVGLNGSYERSIAERAVRWLKGETRSDFTCQTWFLLAGAKVRAIRLVAEIEKGGAKELLPDPVRLGCLGLNESFLHSVTSAWEFVSSACPAGYRVVWGLGDHQGISFVEGDSGGVSLAVVFRGAMERMPLDTFVAASATLGSRGFLGKVEDGDNKRLAAMEVGCDRVLFHGDTPWDKERSEDGGRKLPVVSTVDTFGDVWQVLSDMERHLRDYKQHWRDEWRKNWPVSWPTNLH